MDVADRERVLKLARMLESSYEQERATAAAKIFDIAKRYKLTLPEAITAASGKVTMQAPPQQAPPRRPRPASFNMKVRVEGEDNKALCVLDRLAQIDQDRDFPMFNSWEQTFIADVAQRYELDAQLSEKQMAIVLKLIRKAERYGV